MQIDKVLVDVYVPSVGKNFDVYLQSNCTMHTACKLLGKAIAEETKEYFCNDDDIVICDATSGSVYNTKMTINKLGIKNGKKLLLI